MRTPIAAGVAAAALFVLASPAAADPAAINGHNCAGFVVSSLAGQGFGQAVAGAAQAQVVDNFGLANCGQDNRNNP